MSRQIRNTCCMFNEICTNLLKQRLEHQDKEIPKFILEMINIIETIRETLKEAEILKESILEELLQAKEIRNMINFLQCEGVIQNSMLNAIKDPEYIPKFIPKYTLVMNKMVKDLKIAILKAKEIPEYILEMHKMVKIVSLKAKEIPECIPKKCVRWLK